MTQTRYLTRKIVGVDVFYREAGPAHAPVILLLHGFPLASHMFRDLIPLLADRYRLIAPDLQRWMSQRAGSTVVEVENGHMLPMTNPDAVASVIRQAAEAVD